MNKLYVGTAALALLCLGGLAQGDVFNLGSGLTNLDTVRVGDPRNAADTRYNNMSVGSVSYAYNIGKYEVTNAQYCDFLNHKAKSDPYGLWDSHMANTANYNGCNIQRWGESGHYTYTTGNGSASDVAIWGNRPVNWVSFWSTCRFVNWLGNGQGNGDTETGAYTLNEYTGIDGRAIQRNAGWKWAVPNEDEWYKAAFYKGHGTNEGYWDYATQSNTTPDNQVINPDPGNQATYYDGNWTLKYPDPCWTWCTNVGEFENSASAYGTFDQGGNLCEWNENVHVYYGDVVCRLIRGGDFTCDASALLASFRTFNRLDGAYGSEAGFRVVQAVPEPSSMIALLGGLACGLGFIRRGRKM